MRPRPNAGGCGLRMSPSELERWRGLVVEQAVLWRLKRLLDAELEGVAQKMRELVENTGPGAALPLVLRRDAQEPIK